MDAIVIVSRDLLILPTSQLSAANDFANGRGDVFSRRLDHDLSQFSGQFSLAYDQQMFLSGTISREGSSILGAKQKWGWFYGVQAKAALSDQLFFVLGTQNPLDLAGTYPLPLVQLDRFLLKIPMTYVDKDTELEIVSKADEIRQNS